jgi:hypothetical protein
MGFPDALRIHESEQIVGELADGERSRSPWRLPVAPGVKGVDVEVRSILFSVSKNRFVAMCG